MTLQVRDLHKAYGTTPVLQGADLEVPRGRSGFLLGPSGSGKTTLLRIIAGLEAADQGQVLWRGEEVSGTPAYKRDFGFMFQEPALFPHLNVWQNVAFGLRYRHVPRAQRRSEASAWLEMVGLDARQTASVGELSGGQRQRVALARTLAAKPRAVLLDEPFSALDRELRDALGRNVKTLLAKQEVAALWVTHDETEARQLADRLWRMDGGRCVAVERST